MIVPSLDLLKQVQENYSEEFWEETIRKLKLTESVGLDGFKRAVPFFGAQYLELLKNNPERLQPHARTALFDRFIEALNNTNALYGEILADNPARVKFHEELREAYAAQPSGLRAMLTPYQDNSGYQHEVFNQFLDLLQATAEKAKTRNIGNEDAQITNKALAWWVASIGMVWPSGSAITFKLGSYSKDAETYKNGALQILCRLMRVLDPVEEKTMATAMRKAVVRGQLIDRAKLLLN